MPPAPSPSEAASDSPAGRPAGPSSLYLSRNCFLDGGRRFALLVERAAGQQPDHEKRQRDHEKEHQQHRADAAKNECGHGSVVGASLGVGLCGGASPKASAYFGPADARSAEIFDSAAARAILAGLPHGTFPGTLLPHARPTENNTVQQRINTDKTEITYANFCRGTLTPEEVVLDFGFNSNAFGVKVLEEDIIVNNRIIFSPAAAKRLLFLLNEMLGRHEQNFGAIEIDFRRRLKQQGDQPAPNGAGAGL